MSDNTDHSARGRTVALAVLAAVLVAAFVALHLTGVVGPGSDADPAPVDSSSNAQDTARVRLLPCVREQGVDVSDAGAEIGDVFAQLRPAERQRLQAALQGPCQRYASQAFGEASDAHGPDFLDALTRFTACLRRNGADVPDPDPAAPFEVLHSLDQSDPTLAAAIAACRQELPSGGFGG